jgi:hypothetical protein
VIEAMKVFNRFVPSARHGGVVVASPGSRGGQPLLRFAEVPPAF